MIEVDATWGLLGFVAGVAAMLMACIAERGVRRERARTKQVAEWAGHGFDALSDATRLMCEVARELDERVTNLEEKE